MQYVDHTLSRDMATVPSSLCAMLRKERTTHRSGDYLLDPSSCHAGYIVTESDRMQIVDWCYSVVDQLQFDRENVAMAMSMVDRYLSRRDDASNKRIFLRDRERYQLLAMAALYVSIKVTEQTALGSTTLSVLTRGVYSAKEIEEMELKLLHGLSWRIFVPTGVQVAHHVLSLLKQAKIDNSTWCFILNEAKHQIECSVRDYFFCTQRPSTVAIAAIFNALDMINRQDCQALLLDLLSVLNEDLASPEHLRATRYMLQHLVDFNEALKNPTFVLDTSSDVEGCSPQQQDSYEDFSIVSESTIETIDPNEELGDSTRDDKMSLSFQDVSLSDIEA